MPHKNVLPIHSVTRHSALVMWGLERFVGSGMVSRFFLMLLGLIVCYIFGTAWYLILYTSTTGSVSLLTVLGWCVFPFIIPDVVKILLALVLARRIGKYIAA